MLFSSEQMMVFLLLLCISLVTLLPLLSAKLRSILGLPLVIVMVAALLIIVPTFLAILAPFSSDEILLFMFFYALFAIVMLPFASPLLSARLRSRLGLRLVMTILMALLVLAPTVFAVLAPAMLESPYIRFTKKSQRYYSNLAQACDTVLAEHPPGTNDFIPISVTDPSLPKIIKDLHPVRMQAGSYGLWMMLIANSRAGFAIEWGPQQGNTNIWELSADGEGLITTVYTSKHRSFSGAALTPTSK